MYKKLIKWSTTEHGDLPWRKKRTLYRTLVSEIMLQQTTVSTVLNHFERFLKEYPRIEDLAKASEEQVCISWKGLGYYRRARNLRKAAIDIQNNFNGKVPLDYDQLISISGIGEYTANAILGIGKDLPALAVDANLERVLSRIYLIDESKGPKLQKLINKKFQEGELLSDIRKIGPSKLNEALMDLGRVYCQARKASCELCPVSKDCMAFNQAKPLDFPKVIDQKKKMKYYELDLLRIVVKKGKKFLGYEKDENEWLSGQVELPTITMNSEDKTLSQYPKTRKKKFKITKTFKTSITKYRITNHICIMSLDEFNSLGFSKSVKFYQADFDKVNFSTASIKTLEKLTL